MSERTRIYTMHISKLRDPALFNERLKGLSPKSRERISRIRSKDGRCLSLASALLLDQGLSAYHLREKDMRILRGEHGKPYFPDAPSIQFNLSHSGELAMAVFSDTEVGCDIQKMSFHEEPPFLREEKIAERFYTKEENAWVKACEIPLQRLIRFYRIWTLKESYAKATGLGMANTISCGFEMEPEPELLKGADLKSYRFREYSFGGYRAAICLGVDF